MAEAIIFVGIPASGKSTFFNETILRDTHVRVSLDMLRTRHRESVIMKACLDADQSFVIDNTNSLVSDRARYIEAAREYGFRIVCFYFVPDFERSMEWNLKKRAPLPEVALKAKMKILVEPKYDEGFDFVFDVQILASGEFHVKHRGKP